MRRTWTILVDSREKQALPLPTHLSVMDRSSLPTRPRTTTVRIETRRLELKTGDYLLESHPDAIIVERKKSYAEVLKNCTTPVGRRRFLAELRRLNSECAVPYILFEDVPVPVEGGVETAARDAFLDMVLTHRIQFAMMPAKTLNQRRRTGEWLAALLIAGAHHGLEEAARPGDPDPADAEGERLVRAGGGEH